MPALAYLPAIDFPGVFCMMLPRSVALAALIFPAVVSTPVAQESSDSPSVSVEEIASEVAQLDREIAAAEADATEYDGGLPKTLALARVETLKLTRAILQNRMEAERGGARVEVAVPTTPPDPERAAQVLQEIEAQTSAVEDAEKEAENAAGLIGALAASRVQTEKLSLATLKASWFQAQYGTMLPVEMLEEAPTANPTPETDAGDASKAPDERDWADPDHPEIDYSRTIFSQLSEEGFRLSGWWGIRETTAEIDDSPRILALNVSQYEDRMQMRTPQLMVGCSEGTPSIIYHTDDYLLTDYQSNSIPVTYRIDDTEAVSDRWSQVTSSEGGGLFGQRAEEMVRRLYEAEKLFVRITARDGERHDASFKLAGGREAYDAVAAACSFSTLELSADDYKSIQAMLNSAGFEAGTPDGQWGPNSADAMKAFQASVGLPETGAPDRATLKEMGLDF